VNDALTTGNDLRRRGRWPWCRAGVGDRSVAGWRAQDWKGAPRTL